MLSASRPSFEVVKEGRMFLTEKMSWKYFSPTRVVFDFDMMRQVTESLKDNDNLNDLFCRFPVSPSYLSSWIARILKWPFF
jgi:hypothetical protein